MKKRQDMTCRELIKAMGDFRGRFLSGNATTQEQPLCALPEVTGSWKRLLESGANPETISQKRHLDDKTAEVALKRRKYLVDIAHSVLSASIQKDSNTFCSVGIIDENNVLLTACAKGEDIVSFLREANAFDDKKGRGDMPVNKDSVVFYGGLAYDEQSVGTSAWSIANQNKVPVQLINTDQFSSAYAQAAQSITAVPILNADRSVFATVIYVHNLDEPMLDMNYAECARLDLNFAGIIAAAIERHARHQETKPILVNPKSSARDYSIILANEQGDITLFEDKLLVMLGVPDNPPSTIEELFLDDVDLCRTILSGVKCSARQRILGSQSEVGIEAESNTVACSLLSASILIKIKELTNIQLNERSKAESQGQIGFSDILGTSASTMRLKRICAQFASSDENVLLAGESGTGKELIARAMHNESRPQHPFVIFNASAIPKDLLKTALFGYEPGNDAEGSSSVGRAGAIERAGQGTLFLDEIADIPLTIQASLLRIIDDRTVTRIGGTRSIPYECRIIASTNRNIRDLIKRGLFREDLYYRLATLGILVDPLRKRPIDVIPIYRNYLRIVCEKRGTPIPMVSESFVNALQDCEWPGNVRQLQNAIIYAVNMAEAEQSSSLTKDHLPPLVVLGSAADEYHGTLGEAADDDEIFNLAVLEKKTIQRAYRVVGGNPTRMASMLGISMSTLNRRLKEYGLTKGVC